MGGGDLFSKVEKKGRFSEAEARRILIQVARGLEYLHSVGICHRDIKPENILCSEEDEGFTVKIADFGLSRLFGVNELMTTNCGSPYYAAPEVLAHTDPYNESCDIWGFGVLAYILLTGHFPFSAPDNALPALIKSGKYNLKNLAARKVSIPAQEFIARLLVLDAKSRPTATEILRDPWLVGTDMPDVDLSESVIHLSRLGSQPDDEPVKQEEKPAEKS